MKRIRRFGYEHATEIALFLATCALLAAACGCTVDYAIKTTSVAAVPLSGLVGMGYKAANIYDTGKVASIRDRQKAGDDAGALAEWRDYLPKIQKVQDGLDAGSDLVSALIKTIEAARVGLAHPSDLYDYLPKLAAAANDIRNALKTIGVNTP